MKVMVSDPSGNYRLISDVPQPKPQPDTMLVHVHAVSLNPYDAKIVDYEASGAYVGGCDFAGVIVAVDAGVTRFRPGDRVLTINTHGGFAEYALAVEDLSCHVPEGMPFNQACSLGLAVGIAGLALFQEPGLNLPLLEGQVNLGPVEAAVNGQVNGQVNGDINGEINDQMVGQEDGAETTVTVLVAGGASASGTMATQLLKLSAYPSLSRPEMYDVLTCFFPLPSAGFNPIVTCSPVNNALCESFGASACFDYHSPTCGVDIRLHTDNTLAHVLDCVTDAATMKMCYEAIGSQGGAYIALEPTTNTVKYTRRDVRADWVMANTLLGDPCQLHGIYGRPGMPEHRQFAGRLFRLAERWLRDGKIWNHPLEIRDGGLESVESGLQDLRAGIIRGKKLVVPLEVEAY